MKTDKEFRSNRPIKTQYSNASSNQNKPKQQFFLFKLFLRNISMEAHAVHQDWSHTWHQQRTNAVHPGLESYVTPAEDRPFSDKLIGSTKQTAIGWSSTTLTITHNLHTINSTLVYLWVSNLESLGYGMILKSCYNNHWNCVSTEWCSNEVRYRQWG